MTRRGQGGFQVGIALDGCEQFDRAQQELKRSGDEAADASDAHAAQPERQSDRLGHRKPLRFHADRPVGQNPGLLLKGPRDRGRGVLQGGR